MKKQTNSLFGKALAMLLALVMVIGMLPGTAFAAEPSAAEAAGYVSDDLVLWLDANNNTGNGYDAAATQWVNLANPEQKVDVSKFSWGTDSEHNAHYLNLANGWIILPDEVRQAIGSSEFTIEFIMDDYDGVSKSGDTIRNLMNATGDAEWLTAQTKAVATPNDNFVLFMNEYGGGNSGKFCFRTCYTNSSNGWTKLNTSAGSDYCKVDGSLINDVTNSLTFKAGGTSHWYLGGKDSGYPAVNSNKKIDVEGFRTNPSKADTWQTARKPQITFGTDNSVIASRVPFSAKVKAIRVYKSELSAAEVRQNAAADQERYYTFTPTKLPTQNYVTDNLVLWLDANNNTGKGYDANATQWVNLANTAQKVDVSKFSWGEDADHGSNWLNLSNGCIFLPDDALAALEGQTFTIEFIMDDFDGSSKAKTQNIMTITGDPEWIASLSGPVGTPNDNFVLFQNASGGNNAGYFCFRTCYGPNWTYIFPSSTKYCMAEGTKVNGVTNTLTFKYDGSSNWYLDGVKAGSTTNNGHTIDATGFRTNPSKADTWTTERRAQLTFGIDNSIISAREAFSAKVRSIRIYTSELTEAQAKQNAEADKARYHSKPNYEVPQGYVQNGLVLFLDALNNTGDGHSNTAANWVNLANTAGDPATFFNGTGTSYTWNESGLAVNGGVILPAEALAAAAGSNFTVEFLLDGYDAAIQKSVTRNLLVLIGPDGTSGVWDDDFVCFQNSTAANPANAHQWCFDIKNASHTKYGRISVTASSVNGVTNAITFDHDVQVQWLQDGVAKSTGKSGASASWVTDINLTNGTRLVFGAAPGYMSGKAFAGNVKAIRVYDRTLSAAELAQNAAVDANRYMTTEKLNEVVRESWGKVITGGPTATTASGLQSFAQSVMDAAASEHLNVSVTDNLDGTFTFTYTSRKGVAGFEPQSYTLFVNGEYFVDFSTLSADGQARFLHDIYTHQGGGAMTASIKDGALVYDLTNATRPVSGLYLPVINTTNEYVWEMEIVYQGTGWAGQLFAVKDLETPQNTCTFNLGSGSSAAAYEFCYRNAANSWNSHVTTTLGASNFGTGKLDAAKFNANYSAKSGVTFKLKYVVKDGMAFGFIDDVLIVESANLPADYTGGFGINTASPDLYVKSIRISTDVGSEMVYSPIGHYDIDIYEPQTAIKVAPTIMLQASEELYNVSGLAKRPASVIFTAKAEDGVLNVYDGNTKLGTFDELYNANFGKAIMGLRITDKAAADLIIAHAVATKNENLWVFSADGALLKYINDSCARIRGVVEIPASDLTDIVTNDVTRTAVYDKIYGYGHRTCVIPASAATEDVIRELQSMKLAVIVEGYGLTEAQIYDLIVFGPAGILTDNYAAFISKLESFTDYTLVRPSMVVGHRGDRKYPDNSLESIISAAQSGAAASEFDVIATLDGYLVLSHDNDNYEAVEYRNGTWAGVAITNAYWKKANAEAAGRPNDYFEGRYFHTSTSQTPVLYATLDQLFDATGTQYPGLTYHIEVKDSQNDKRTGKSGKLVVNLIDELLRSDKYAALRGRCDILCFDTGINYPSTQKGYAVHNQNSKTVTADLAVSIYNYESFYRPINSLLEPGTNVVTIPTLEVFKHYGMICCPWTYNNGGLYQAYMMGYHGFTTDYPHVSDGIYRKLTATVDAEGKVTAQVYTLADHLGTAPVDVSNSVELFAITNADKVTIANGTVTVTEGEAAIGSRYWVSLPNASGSQKGFWLYGGSFTVEAARYTVTVEAAEHGSVSADKAEARDGDTVTLTVTPDAGYEVDTVSFNGTVITPVGGVYSFVMPEADVIVTATFKAIPATAPVITEATGCEVILDYTQGIVSVIASADQGHTLTYQWYDGEGTAMDGATASTLNIPTGLAVGSYTFSVTVTATRTDNGETASAEAEVTVTVLPKYEQTGFAFSITEKSAVYGDAPYTETASGQVEGSTVTYTSSNPAVASVDPVTGEVTIHKSGTVTITATASETQTYAEVTAGYTLTVTKKAVTLTAVDKQIMISFPAPNYASPVAGADDLVEGLVNGDTIRVIMSTNADMYKAGSYTIYISAAEDARYDFITVNGVLQVMGGSGAGVGNDDVGYDQPAVECNCGKFTDIDTGLWYHTAVCWAVNSGIMNGTGDGTTFSPWLNVSRAMMMTMLARLNGVDTTVGATWYEAGMKWAMDKGISDGTNPNGDLTREQMVTMLYRYAGKPAVAGNLIQGFKDADQVSDWAYEAMNWAVTNGIIQGNGTGLNPKGTATRAEIAQILYNFFTK